MRPRLRDQTGQTAAEYLGMLLIVAVIVGALASGGVAEPVVDGVTRAVCTIAAGGDGAGCGDAGGEDDPAPGGGAGPDTRIPEREPAAPADPVGPTQGPVLGDGPLPVPDLAWDGSVTVSGEVSDTSGLYLESSVTLEESECRFDAAGNPIVSVGVTGTLKTGARYDAENPVGGVSVDAYVGNDVSYRVSTNPEAAQQMQDGDRPPPNPIDPSSIPEGSAITLDEASYDGLDLGATYRGLQLSMGFEEGRRLSSAVERVDGDTVRVTVGDSDLVRDSLGLGFGGDLAALEASSLYERSAGETRQVDIDVSTPAGLAAYEDFIETGSIPGPGRGVTDPRTSEVFQLDASTELGGTIGPLSGSLFARDRTGTTVGTTNPDGTISVVEFNRREGVGLTAQRTVAADGTEGPRTYVLTLQGVSDDAAQYSAQLDGYEDYQDVRGGDLRMSFDDDDLRAMHEDAVDQVVYAHQVLYAEERTREEIEQLIEDDAARGGLAGRFVATLAGADEPVEMAEDMWKSANGQPDSSSTSSATSRWPSLTPAAAGIATSSCRCSTTSSRSGPPSRCPPPAERGQPALGRRTLDELDAVAVRVAHEAQSRAALADLVGRLLGRDPLGGEARQRAVEVLDRERDVVVAGAEVVLGHAEVVGQLEPVAVAGEPHEDVDRLVADGHPPALLEAERLVEGDRAVDVADPVAGVDELHGGAEVSLRAMILERSMSGQWLSNTYLVAAGPGSDAFFVDAGGPLGPLLDKVGEHRLEPTHVLLTHHHFDHVAELATLKDRFPGIEVLIHPGERDLVDGATGDLEPEAELEVGGLTVRALHTPGHTSGMLSLLVGGTDVFTGDTLFKNSVGGVRAPGHTTYADLKRSIMEVLLALPGETVIRPGHTEPTTVADELETNAFVRCGGAWTPRAPSRARRWASRPPWSCSATTTTAATRRGSAGPTAPTTSSRGRRCRRRIPVRGRRPDPDLARLAHGPRLTARRGAGRPQLGTKTANLTRSRRSAGAPPSGATSRPPSRSSRCWGR